VERLADLRKHAADEREDEHDEGVASSNPILRAETTECDKQADRRNQAEEVFHRTAP
jgi:hypothetical protein